MRKAFVVSFVLTLVTALPEPPSDSYLPPDRDRKGSYNYASRQPPFQESSNGVLPNRAPSKSDSQIVEPQREASWFRNGDFSTPVEKPEVRNSPHSTYSPPDQGHSSGYQFNNRETPEGYNHAPLPQRYASNDDREQYEDNVEDPFPRNPSGSNNFGERTLPRQTGYNALHFNRQPANNGYNPQRYEGSIDGGAQDLGYSQPQAPVRSNFSPPAAYQPNKESSDAAIERNAFPNNTPTVSTSTPAGNYPPETEVSQRPSPRYSPSREHVSPQSYSTSHRGYSSIGGSDTGARSQEDLYTYESSAPSLPRHGDLRKDDHASFQPPVRSFNSYSSPSQQNNRSNRIGSLPVRQPPPQQQYNSPVAPLLETPTAPWQSHSEPRNYSPPRGTDQENGRLATNNYNQNQQIQNYRQSPSDEQYNQPPITEAPAPAYYYQNPTRNYEERPRISQPNFNAQQPNAIEQVSRYNTQLRESYNDVPNPKALSYDRQSHISESGLQSPSAGQGNNGFDATVANTYIPQDGNARSQGLDQRPPVQQSGRRLNRPNNNRNLATTYLPPQYNPNLNFGNQYRSAPPTRPNAEPPTSTYSPSKRNGAGQQHHHPQNGNEVRKSDFNNRYASPDNGVFEYPTTSTPASHAHNDRGSSPPISYGTPNQRGPNANQNTPIQTTSSFDQPLTNYGAPNYPEEQNLPGGHNRASAPDLDHNRLTDYQSLSNNDEQDESANTGPAKYKFNYKVSDRNSGAQYSQSETREGNTAQGRYQLRLPDGRLQTVDYEADSQGFRSKIRYEGEPIDEIRPTTQANNYQRDSYDPAQANENNGIRDRPKPETSQRSGGSYHTPNHYSPKPNHLASDGYQSKRNYEYSSRDIPQQSPQNEQHGYQ